jgi:hypothetical protein
MTLLKLSIATTDYDHFRDFRLGLVRAEGIDHTWLTLGHHEVFARFTFNREWDVSELSFAKFMAQVTRDGPDIIGLLATISFLLVLCEQEQQYQRARRPQGQDDWFTRVGAHRRRLYAWLAHR